MGPRLNLEAFRRPSYSTGITSPQSSAEASKGAAASFSFGVHGADMMRRAATIAATRAFAAPLDHDSGAASWRLPMDDRQPSPRVATAGAPLGLSSIDALSIKSGYDAAVLGCCIFDFDLLIHRAEPRTVRGSVNVVWYQTIDLYS